MKRFFLSALVVGASALYVLFRAAASPAAASGASAAAESTPTSTASASSVPAARGFKDGAYTGPLADAFYGTVQVQATVSGGRLTNVAFLSYPNELSTSRFINGQAMSMLIHEAVVAQNAKVNIISGATDTSLAFRASLASALAQARS